MDFANLIRRFFRERVATPEELAVMLKRVLEAKKQRTEMRLVALEQAIDLSSQVQLLDHKVSRLEAKFYRALRTAAHQRSRYWRCPHCKTQLEKPSFDMVEQLLEKGVDFSVTTTCPKCGGESLQTAVYGGRFDA